MKKALYDEILDRIIDSTIALDELREKTVVIVGATGLVGVALTDIFMRLNQLYAMEINVIAIGRNEEHLEKLYNRYEKNKLLQTYVCDALVPFFVDLNVDHIIYAASNTHPQAYVNDPIGTIMINVAGAGNWLEYGVRHNVQKFIYLSSVEIYGENRSDVECFDETYMGYLDCNTLRAGYPESKRVGEALCQAYKEKYDLDVVSARLCRVYGPTMLETDSKVIAQFIKNAVDGKDIILKSEGTQQFSYVFSLDAAMGIICLLLKGKSGEAYNVACREIFSLKEIAGMTAKIGGCNVYMGLADKEEQKGYSVATKALMNTNKIEKLGWKAMVELEEGLQITIDMKKYEC